MVTSQRKHVIVVLQPLKDLQFDLCDTSCWEHLLPGEPWGWQQVGKDVDLDQADTKLLEKHLDIPSSWVLRLDIPHHSMFYE